MHRQVFVLAGDKSWQKDTLKDILQGYESDSLWVGEQAPESYPFVEFRKAHNWLGNEKRVIIFDANKNFEPDSFAAISGIVVGGGFFILLLPTEDKWDKIYPSLFGQRLLQSINNMTELVVIKQNVEKFNFSSSQSTINISSDCIAPFLTSDQQCAVENIEEQVFNELNNSIVLISDRGRGKSAALGIAAARFFQSGMKNITLTAPRLRATDIIFKHIKEILPEAEVARGCIKYGESVIQFYSPDQLMQEDINTDLLLIDEAAAIPVPLLTSFLDKYPQCVFATTVHGYEGTGRGFALRFNKILAEKTPDWLKLQMQTPIRWPENDPLEKWMFNLLCLDAEIADTISTDKFDLDNCEHHLLTKKQLVNNGLLLKEVFALLVLAHYRTRPKDLKSLLDDDKISLYVTLNNKHVVAVALVIHEGLFSDSLSTLVYQGKRRPKGHLLAQTLTYHCGVEHAATLDYARVMRIAVHPELQLQGTGTALLDFIIRNEKQNGRDAVGSSFGMNKPLLDFWRKSKFNVVRIGFTREQTSGEHAAIILLPLTEQGEKINQEAHARFLGQLPFLFNDVLNDIPSVIKNSFQYKEKVPLELTQLDKADLQSFIHYSRNYELCIAALNKTVLLKKDDIVRNDFSDNFRDILKNKVIEAKSWKDIRKKMGLSGQNEARKLFHSAIIYLMTF